MENVAWGSGLSPQGAVDSWNDDVHLATMLSTKYVDAGAGATTDAQGNIFYTLDVCYIADGNPARPNQESPWASNTPSIFTTAEPTQRRETTETAAPPFEVAVQHVVQPGDTLTAIAKTYGIPLEQLLALNNIKADDIIYPGDKLVIQLAPTATPTASPTASLTSESTATATPVTPAPTFSPTYTFSATQAPGVTNALSATQASGISIVPVTLTPAIPAAVTQIAGQPAPAAGTMSSPRAVAAVLLALAGIGLLVWGIVLKRRS